MIGPPLRTPPALAGALLLCAAFATPSAAWAQASEGAVDPTANDRSADEQRERYAGKIIQERTHVLEHEVAVTAGLLPVDPYYKGYTVRVSYAWHLGEFFAIEPLSFTWSFNDDTQLRGELERVAVAEGNLPPEFDELQLVYAPHLIIKPFYGKQTLFNRTVVHVEGWLQAGPALTRYASPSSELGYGFDTGAGLRFWFDRRFSMRVEIGNLVYWDTAGLEQDLHLNLGIAVNFRGPQ